MNAALCGLAVAMALTAMGARADAPGYAHPEMLVDAAWLAAHAHDASVRIVDMREAKAYAAGHIPGAVHIEEGPLRNPEDRFTYLPTPDRFAAMMRQAGIGNGTHVVAYDDQGGKMAARLWYVLGAYGDNRVSLLNGGWNRWTAEGRPVSMGSPHIAPSRFAPRFVGALTCPSPALLARQPGVVVLDARSPAEWTGATVSPGATKAGRIPGAVNVEWKENVTGPEMVFKPADALRAMYAAKGLTPDKQIVVHCASGGRAAQSLFTLKLLGYPHVRIYYGSFADYTSRPNAPIEKP